MKKFMAIFVAFLIAVGAVLCTERVHKIVEKLNSLIGWTIDAFNDI